jgi:hypothetical protein
MRDRRILFALIALVLLLPSLALTEENTVRRLPRRDGKIVEERCPVHHEVMAVEIVPIQYGLLRPEAAGPGPRQEVEEYWREKEAHFPETTHWVAGGCVVGSQRKAEVHVCRSCQEAEADWLKRHPGLRMP